MGMSITNSLFSASSTYSATVAICYTPFAPHTISEPVNVSLVNCNIQRGDNFGLYLSASHGDSYLLDVSLNGIIAQNGDTYIAFSDSNFLININKLTSFNGVTGLTLHSIQFDSSSVTALPSSVVITDSDIYNNVRGIVIELYQAYTTGQSITLHSCRIYNNNDNEI